MSRTTIELIVERHEPFAGGTPFGDVGPYEKIQGRVLFGIDPDDARNRAIVDLSKAARNSSGLVEYSTPFFLLKPQDMKRGNRRLLYDVNNRGRKRALLFFNDAPDNADPSSVQDSGNGFLMRRGYTVLWSGWQGDLLPVEGRMTMAAPVPTHEGAEITGPVRAEFIVETQGIRCIPLSGNQHIQPYETVSLDTQSASLTARQLETDSRDPIPRDAWRFARINDQDALEPSPTDCYLAAGFRPGWIYELIYQARNPKVLGLGFAGVRDLVDFLRHRSHDSAGHDNPLWDQEPGIEKAYAWGRSQSGRFLREFVYRGFNIGANDRRIFEGISAHVAGAGRLALNYRFAQPDRYPRQHEEHLFPSDEFPFSYHSLTDPHTRRSDAILKRPDTDPYLIHTQTATEYWQRRGSLVHTDASGADLPEHPLARVYLLASLQHNDSGAPAEGGEPRYALNPLPANPVLRALLDALDDWATRGLAPPASRMPSHANGTLVSQVAYHDQFPRIPGLSHPPKANLLFLTDHGVDFDQGIIATEPPIEDSTRAYPVFVPCVDPDGNEECGVRVPEIESPLATYAGWNLCAESDIMAGIAGSMVPFPKTATEREQKNDPRRSIEERYGSKNAYLDRVRTAAAELCQERLLLDEDIARCLERASQQWDAIVGTGKKKTR